MPNCHEGCGGIIVNFSSFTEDHNTETPICTKCGAVGESVRTPVDPSEDPCKNCDGSICPLLEEMGVTCMGIEGLEIIPAKEE